MAQVRGRQLMTPERSKELRAYQKLLGRDLRHLEWTQIHQAWHERTAFIERYAPRDELGFFNMYRAAIWSMYRSSFGSLPLIFRRDLTASGIEAAILEAVKALWPLYRDNPSIFEFHLLRTGWLELVRHLFYCLRPDI